MILIGSLKPYLFYTTIYFNGKPLPTTLENNISVMSDGPEFLDS